MSIIDTWPIEVLKWRNPRYPVLVVLVDINNYIATVIALIPRWFLKSNSAWKRIRPSLLQNSPFSTAESTLIILKYREVKYTALVRRAFVTRNFPKSLAKCRNFSDWRDFLSGFGSFEMLGWFFRWKSAWKSFRWTSKPTCLLVSSMLLRTWVCWRYLASRVRQWLKGNTGFNNKIPTILVPTILIPTIVVPTRWSHCTDEILSFLTSKFGNKIISRKSKHAMAKVVRCPSSAIQELMHGGCRRKVRQNIDPFKDRSMPRHTKYRAELCDTQGVGTFSTWWRGPATGGANHQIHNALTCALMHCLFKYVEQKSCHRVIITFSLFWSPCV